MSWHRTKGISLLEILIIITIITIISAMAVPRKSVASDIYDLEMNLKQDLAVLRYAIDLYYDEHNSFPGQFSDGKYEAHSQEAFIAQLTLFTDKEGNTSLKRDERFIYGPYLRTGLPILSVGENAGKSAIKIINEPMPPKADPQFSAGWVFNTITGQIIPNTKAIGSDSVSYASY